MSKERALSAQVRVHLEAGRKIEAVKSLRAESGLGLEAALEVVDAHILADPRLAAQFAARSAAMRPRVTWTIIVAIALVVLAAWAVFGSRSARGASADVSAQALDAGQAFLLLRFDMVYDPQMGRPARLRLGRLGSDEEVVVFRQAPLQVLRVPAGRYYLRGADPGIYDSSAVTNPAPADVAQTLDVAAGAAVYVGDFVFDEKRKLTQRYTRASLRAAQANSALHRYPLKVAKAGAATVTIAWD